MTSGSRRRQSARRSAAASPEVRAPESSRSATVFLGGVTAALLIAAVTFPMFDPDIWQHLAVGRYLWAGHSIPMTQIWAWPVFGQPDVMPSWLFRVLLWPFWERGGELGLFLWRWGTVLATFGLAGAAARAAGARGPATAIVLVLCALTWRWRSQVRPETLVSVLIAAQFLLLEKHRSVHPAWNRVVMAGLPSIALLWANMHISYWFGFALTGAYLLDSLGRERGIGPRSRTLIGAAALAAAASFLNPHGWLGLWQPFEYQFHWRNEPIFRSIPEIGPIVWSIHGRDGLPFLLAGSAALMLWRTRRRFDLAQWVLVLGVGALALTSQRFLGPLAIVLAVFTSRDLSEWLRSRWIPLSAVRWPAVLGVSLLSVLICIPELFGGVHRLGMGVDWSRQPGAACDWMERHGVRGRGFNTFAFGGFLLWRFHPQQDRLPFMDIHQAGTKQDRYDYAYSLSDSASWRRLSDRYAFDWVLLPRQTLPGDHLLDFVDGDDRFALVFWDDASALYLRRTGPMAGIAEREQYRLLPGGQTRLMPLADRSFRDDSLRARVRAELRRAQAGSPFHANALSLLANVALQEGAWEEAIAILDSAGARSPGIGRLEMRRNLASDSLRALRARRAAAESTR